MLIQKMFGTARMGFVACALLARATKPDTIASRLLFRLLPRGALSDLFQIDQISHSSLRYADRWSAADRRRKLS
jgi:hypothetical protein